MAEHHCYIWKRVHSIVETLMLV